VNSPESNPAGALPTLTLASVLPLSQATDEEMSNLAHRHQGERIIRAAPAVANAAKTGQRAEFESKFSGRFDMRRDPNTQSRYFAHATNWIWESWQAAIAPTAPNTAMTLTDEQIIGIATTTRSAEANKDGGYILPISFARAILAAAGTPP
jgi:hypothetical protein